ncbi:hypothetical protein LCGC14_1627180 [marine sediment metagenome]|uniref:Uncharacterized protein n=1 Tax=marine sediment metagenome TaxID=412755 RepID=A0A0F9L3F7_9ZZZZ
MKTTLIIKPVPKNRRALGELFDAMKKSGVKISYGESFNELVVEVADQKTAEKILTVHGFWFDEEKNLTGAMNKLADKYMLNEIFDFPTERQKSKGPKGETVGFGKPGAEPGRALKVHTIDKRQLSSFLHRKLREARFERVGRRTQHIRDELRGQVHAYEEVLRQIKKLSGLK